jgi:hypothetical protein
MCSVVYFKEISTRRSHYLSVVIVFFFFGFIQQRMSTVYFSCDALKKKFLLTSGRLAEYQRDNVSFSVD